MTTPFQEDYSAQEDRVVLFWSGQLSNIPKGWVVSDGNNGTIDLTDKFIKAPSDYSNGPGATGGQKTVSLSGSQLPSHDHTGDVSSGGYHSHNASDGFNNSNSGSDIGSLNSSGGGPNTSSNGSHSHGGDSSDATGSGNGIDNRPAYYETVPLQKI